MCGPVSGCFSSMNVCPSTRCWSLSGGVGAVFASLRAAWLGCSMVGVSTSTLVTMSFTGLIGSGTCWAPGCPLLPVPRGGSDATMSGRESGDGDSSPTLVGWFLDVVVSLAGRWFEGWFPPAFVDRLTGEEHSWFGRFNLVRSSPDGGLLSTDNGVASSLSLTDVAAVLGERVACVSCLDVRED